MQKLTAESFDRLIKKVVEAGNYAREQQHTVTRNFKPDGSVLTEIDTRLDALLTAAIKDLFPGNRIVSEENPVDTEEITSWTFTLDPIDGTDSYSQGMPGWCVAVGMLDEQMNPAGAVIYAPSWGNKGGNLLTLMPGGSFKINGTLYSPLKEESGNKFQIMASSNLHHYFDCHAFEGKIRNTGSGVLNVVGPLLHSAVKGALLTPCYIWDLAASHAILKHVGLSMEYLNRKPINYTYLAKRKKAEDYIIAGSKETLAILRHSFMLSRTYSSKNS